VESREKYKEFEGNNEEIEGKTQGIFYSGRDLQDGRLSKF
jgi:hypothetical protein